MIKNYLGKITDKVVAFEMPSNHSACFPCRNGTLMFKKRGKADARSKACRDNKNYNHKLNPLKTSALGLEPGLHYWEATALILMSFLLPASQYTHYMI